MIRLFACEEHIYLRWTNNYCSIQYRKLIAVYWKSKLNFEWTFREISHEQKFLLAKDWTYSNVEENCIGEFVYVPPLVWVYMHVFWHWNLSMHKYTVRILTKLTHICSYYIKLFFIQKNNLDPCSQVKV